MGRAYCIRFGAEGLTLELESDAELFGPPGADPVKDDEAATIRQELLMPEISLSIVVLKEMTS